MVRRLLVGLLVLAAACWTSPPAHAGCGDLVPAPPASAGTRTITARDLAAMRDIGYPDVVPGPTSPYALSPDGRSLAFVIARADPASNEICSALVVAPVDGRGPTRILDRGGSLPLITSNVRGLLVTTGFPEEITALWSPDGRWIAYRKRVAGTVQIVRARAKGTVAEVVTQAPVDVEDFAWAPDGTRLVYRARIGLVAERRRIAEESHSGWLYDERVLPHEAWQPQPWASEVPPVSFTLDLRSGQARASSYAEKALLVAPAAPGYGFDILAENGHGRRAWTQRTSANPMADQQLWVTTPGGAHLRCRHDACTGRISRLFWVGGSLIFIRHEGWNNEETAVYRWNPDTEDDALTTIVRTSDALTGCIAADAELICGRENAATPRRIVGIELASGRSRTIFDPNPEFAYLDLGKVTRLRWRNDRDLPAWGDLVLPPGYDGTAKLPLIVVLYHSRGFLRGGVGDDYPVFPLAAKGFAVLSIERPPDVAEAIAGITTWEQVLAANHRGWAERRSIHSAVMTGIDQAIVLGVVDPQRIGITGLSDGASTVEFALVNSHRFAAAAMSTCCDDLLTSLVLGGFNWGKHNRRYGFPPSVDDDRAFWEPISLSVNARRIDTPILMQLADREAHLALPAIGALTEAEKPVEMYVYPDEYHNKWQPVHRIATYERNIDWFAFWLQGRRDPDPIKRQQYERWEALRTRSGNQGDARSKHP